MTVTTDIAPPPPRRSLWTVFGSLAAVSVLAIGVTQGLGFASRGDRTVDERFDAESIDVVEIDTDAGSVFIDTASGTSIEVHARVREGFRSAGLSSRIQGRRLILEARCPGVVGGFCEIDYEVSLPARMRVVAISRNDHVEAHGIDGGVTLTSHNGDVVGDDLGGEVRLESRNGEVRGTRLAASVASAESDNGDVRLAFDAAPASITARSDNGSVEVVVPPGSEMYAVEADSDNGDVSTPVRSDPSSDRRLVAESDNGDVTVRYP